MIRQLRATLRPAVLLLLAAGLPAAPAEAQTPPPPAASQVLSRITFGSCNRQMDASPILGAIAGARADVFLFIGDTVYADRGGRRASVHDLTAAYQALARNPDYDRLRRTTPILAVWDDHDYGRNDGGAADYLPAMQAAFLDQWQVPADDPRRRRRGVYHAFSAGPEGRRVQLVLLDTRSFRSPLKRRPRGEPGGRYLPDPDPGKTMLGDAQWRWLEQRLREPADVRLIVSSIQVLAEGHGWERWGNLPGERARLLALLRDTGARGAILLSGDRHVGALYADRRSLDYPLIELTSSALNASWAAAPPEPGPHLQGDLARRDNFGLIEIDWQARAVALSLRGVDGTALLRQRLDFAELGH